MEGPKIVELDKGLIDKTRLRIEKAILPAMESLYLHDGQTYRDSYGGSLKTIEKVVSYYDYGATGISVLAKLACDGNERAWVLIRNVTRNADYYRNHLYNHCVGDRPHWTTPLRRLLLHLALAYERLCPLLSSDEKQRYVDLINEQVPLAIEHCGTFLPGVKDLHLTGVNNHTAIFMQGIYYCGKVLGRADWMELTLDFAERYFESGHVDGYFEEHTNTDREGGPSLVYTRLTAGCLYDVLDGRAQPRQKFTNAGNYYRSFLNHDFRRIPLADERTNNAGTGDTYGLALHSLTDRGRFYIVNTLESMDYSRTKSESLAVIYHELDLMVPGKCAPSENREDGFSRATLPLGVVRKKGFTAGISALRALNREIQENSDYALDQQNLVYLSHQEQGVILTGIKSKNNPEYSTFRIGDDAYPVATGVLEIGEGWAKSIAHYRTFKGIVQWEIGDTAKLTLSVDTDRTVATSLPITDCRFVESDCRYEVKELPGFSPYAEGNKAGTNKSLLFHWKGSLTIRFNPLPAGPRKG